jgi:hypothetical protein
MNWAGFSRNWLDFLKLRILLDWKRNTERTSTGIMSQDLRGTA